MPQLYINNFIMLLRHYRLEAKLNQGEMAHRLGVSLRTYQRIEAGESIPSLDLIVKASESLGFQFSEIFSQSESISPEHKILLRALRMLERALEISRVGAWEYDIRENKLHWNSITREIHEIEDGVELSVEGAIDFYKIGPDRKKIRDAVSRCIEFGTPFDLQLQLITAKGREITVRSQGAADFENGTCIRIYGSFQDITHTHAQFQATYEAHKKLHRIQNLSHVGMWELDLPTGSLICSDTYRDIFEIDKKFTNVTIDDLLNRVHPEDRNKVRELLINAGVRKLTPESRYRLLFPDGRTKWIMKNSDIDIDQNGTPIRKFGCALDITSFVSH